VFSSETYSVTYNKDKHPEDYTIVDTWYNSFGNDFEKSEKGLLRSPDFEKGLSK
jgi:hypothetical protein